MPAAFVAFMNSMKTMKGADKDGFPFGLWVPGLRAFLFFFFFFFGGGGGGSGFWFRAPFFKQKGFGISSLPSLGPRLQSLKGR